MDHIAPSSGSSLPHIEVPYLCSGLPPCSTEALLKWMRNAAAWFRAHRTDPLEAVAAEVQNNMHFGLLSAILCKAIDRDTITRSDNGGRRTVDSIKVDALLKERREHISRTPPPLRDRGERSRAVYILKDTWDIVNGPMLDYLLQSGFHHRSDLWSEPAYAVIFSIDVFLDLLDTFVRRPDRWRSRRRRALFWIDSLCIPTIPDKNDDAVSDERRKTLGKSKSKAINSMAQLYAGAEQVLVFDPEIQHLPYEAVAGDKYALALCIKCCPWMARSWPLQEGALGQNLYIRFKDRSVLLNSSIYGRVGLPSFRMLEHYEQFPTTLEEEPVPSPISRLAEVWDSLANRSSTMTEDLPAILATMLDRSAEEILGLRGDRRMKALLKMEETLPLAMFYQPNSFVAGRWNPNVPGSDPGQTSAHPHFGVLRVTQEGLILVTSSLYDTSVIIVHEEPRSDHFTLEVNGADGDSMRYSISQDLSKVKKGDNDTCKSLFLLSMLCATGTPKYHGACFSVNTLQSGRLTIRFKTTVLWNYLDTKADPVGPTYTNCQWLEDYEEENFKEVLVDIGTYRF
ncbi:hypothetical protein DL771_000098 [Monosporascus sp. 5C6A]|nr:hypothetical protein DL771_000098 [Monosporascus sp. 5C6A]